MIVDSTARCSIRIRRFASTSATAIRSARPRAGCARKSFSTGLLVRRAGSALYGAAHHTRPLTCSYAERRPSSMVSTSRETAFVGRSAQTSPARYRVSVVLAAFGWTRQTPTTLKPSIATAKSNPEANSPVRSRRKPTTMGLRAAPTVPNA